MQMAPCAAHRRTRNYTISMSRSEVECLPDRHLETLLRERWSCRAFLPDAVPTSTIQRMFAIAQRAPSWCNTQPWHVHVTTGQATARFRAALLAHVAETGAESKPDYAMPHGYSGIHRERRRASGWQLYEAVGVARGNRAASARQAARNFELFDAPHVAIVTTVREQKVYGAVDAGIYLGVLLLAAQSLGLGAIPQAALARLSPFLRDYFQIDDDRGVLVAMSFGYPDLTHPANSYRTERAALEDAMTLHE
jgi:nitroreductase